MTLTECVKNDKIFVPRIAVMEQTLVGHALSFYGDILLLLVKLRGGGGGYLDERYYLYLLKDAEYFYTSTVDISTAQHKTTAEPISKKLANIIIKKRHLPNAVLGHHDNRDGQVKYEQTTRMVRHTCLSSSWRGGS